MQFLETPGYNKHIQSLQRPLNYNSILNKQNRNFNQSPYSHFRPIPKPYVLPTARMGLGNLALLGASQGAFLPSDIAGLKLWLDADDSSTITLSGSEITQWDDKSSSGFIFTPASSSQRPTLTVSAQNGRDAATFVKSESDELLSTVNSGISGGSFAFTAFLVFKKISSLSSMTILSMNENAATNSLAFIFDSLRPATDHWLPAGAKMDDSITNSTWFLLVIRTTQWSTHNTSTTMWLDGVSKSTSTYGSFSTPSLTNKKFRIGNWDSTRSDMDYDGDIGEILWYTSALNTTDRVKVEDYLKDRWGL